MAEPGWALVTGAARRIGRALALAAARAGYDVIVHIHHDASTEDAVQTAAAITALQSYLSKYGIATSVYPDGLDVTASGTAADFDRALSVQLQQYNVPAMAAWAGTPPSRPSRCTAPRRPRTCPRAWAPACWPSWG
jgi:NAD(P)-dependent dehydrogenase (short-subunit alcohol dehydrogenase family)